MLNLFFSIAFENPMIVSVCLFFVAGVFAFCGITAMQSVAANLRKYSVKIPITGQTLRQATARAKAFSKRNNGEHEYYVCLHTGELFFACYEIVRADKYLERKRFVNNVLNDYFEKIS